MELSALYPYSFVDPTVVHPSSLPSHLHWRIPDSPSPAEFAGLHPSYPPARFLASFAQGGWTARYERFEGHPSPRLHPTPRHTALIRQERAELNLSSNGHLRLYCDGEEDPSYRQSAVRPPPPSTCARMWWYTSSQACWILSHFTVVHLSGDSLMRQVHQALAQVLSDNFDDGHIDREGAEADGGRGCWGDLGYEKGDCRAKVAYDIHQAGRQICPTLHLDDLPFPSPPVPFPRPTNDPPTTADAPPPPSPTSPVPWLSSVLNVRYHPVFVRSHLGGESYVYPPIQSASERRAVQEKWWSNRTDLHESPQKVVNDPTRFLYSLPTHIGALHIDELGLHQHEHDGWPGDQLVHYDDVMRVLLYESHLHRPPLPIWPLYLGLHVMVRNLFSPEWKAQINFSRTAEVVPTITRHLHLRHSPLQWFAGTNDSEPDESTLDLSLLHHDSPEMVGRANHIQDNPWQLHRWDLQEEVRKCHFTELPPGASGALAGYDPLRQCCSHSVRPWQLLDVVRLTAHVPFSWSYDGTHYKQFVNTWKAQAILNYAHTLIQQHQRTRTA